MLLLLRSLSTKQNPSFVPAVAGILPPRSSDGISVVQTLRNATFAARGPEILIKFFLKPQASKAVDEALSRNGQVISIGLQDRNWGCVWPRLMVKAVDVSRQKVEELGCKTPNRPPERMENWLKPGRSHICESGKMSLLLGLNFDWNFSARSLFGFPAWVQRFVIEDGGRSTAGAGLLGWLLVDSQWVWTWIWTSDFGPASELRPGESELDQHWTSFGHGLGCYKVYKAGDTPEPVPNRLCPNTLPSPDPKGKTKSQ